jgi:hypothetical protein
MGERCTNKEQDTESGVRMVRFACENKVQTD